MAPRLSREEFDFLEMPLLDDAYRLLETTTHI
jgi:hypothetical protein